MPIVRAAYYCDTFTHMSFAAADDDGARDTPNVPSVDCLVITLPNVDVVVRGINRPVNHSELRIDSNECALWCLNSDFLLHRAAQQKFR